MKKDLNLHHLFISLPLPCLVLKIEGEIFTIVEANDTYLELVGSKPEDLLGKTNAQAFPQNPEQKENGLHILSESFKKVATTGEKDCIPLIRYDIPIRGTQNFQERYWSSENLPIGDESGKFTYILHTVRDITQQVLAQKGQQRLEQEHRHFVDNNSDGLYSLDLEGNFTSANDGLANIVDLPLPELLKMNFLPFCHPEDQEMILDNFHRSIAGETIKFVARFISSNGKLLNLHLHLVPMKLNKYIKGVYGIAKDITEITRSHKVIVEKKNFLQANAAFISSLLENELEDSSLEEAFAIIGKTVYADRMYYFDAHTDQDGNTFISQKIEWTSEKASPQINNLDLQNMPEAQVQQMMGSLRKNRPFTSVLGKLPEGELRDIFLDQDIQSMLLLPIFSENTLYGFIGFDDCIHERQWSDEEVTFLQSLAHNLTTALEKRNAQIALKAQEQALIKSEKKFKALVQEGSDLIGILDQDGTYLFISNTSTAILGIPPEDLIDKNAFDFIHPHDKSRVIEAFMSIGKGQQAKLAPFRFKHFNDSWRWMETTATNLSHDPAVEGIVTNSRDITVLLDQAGEIERLNERYRLAATATQDLMYDWNLLADEVDRFHKTASFLGYSIEEVNEKSFWKKHIHPDELKNLEEHVQAALTNPDKNFIYTKYRMLRADGSFAQFMDRAYIIRDSSGKGIRMVGATSDISDLTAKEQALKVANKRFKMAMKATNEMIWDWKIDDDQVERSKAFAKIYGYSDKQNHSVKKFWLTKILGKERATVESTLSAALKDPSAKKWRAEYRFQKANGETAHVVDRGHILRDSSGKAVRMIGAVLDVTASRQSLKKIKDQNERLREIAWQQSHVVRAPLARLQALLALLKSEDFQEWTEEKVWQHIDDSATELDTIIRNIVRKTEEIDQTQ